MKKIILGGLLGGIAIFIGSFIFHMFTPLGTAGIKSLPNEEAVTAVMRHSISKPGLYFFPGMDMSGSMTPEEEKAWTAKYETGPVGLLIYHPVGESPMSPRQLIVELCSDIIAAFFAALIISSVSGSYIVRALLVALFGVITWMSLSISYWNWFGYPGTYIIAEGVDQVFSWGLAGMVMACVIRPPTKG